MSHSGVVARWNPTRGFGFIKSAEFPEDVFVHVSAFGGGELVEGRPVTFDVEDQNGKTRAVNVTGEGVDPTRRSGGDDGFNSFRSGKGKGGSKGGSKGARSYDNNYGGGDQYNNRQENYNDHPAFFRNQGGSKGGKGGNRFGDTAQYDY